jgi:uncharacterized Zn-finger protein
MTKVLPNNYILHSVDTLLAYKFNFDCNLLKLTAEMDHHLSSSLQVESTLSILLGGRGGGQGQALLAPRTLASAATKKKGDNEVTHTLQVTMSTRRISTLVERVVFCDGVGGPLGHPKVYINLVSRRSSSQSTTS